MNDRRSLNIGVCVSLTSSISNMPLSFFSVIDILEYMVFPFVDASAVS